MNWLDWLALGGNVVGTIGLVLIALYEIRCTRKVRAAVWTNPELDTVTTDTLLRELAKRHDRAVFIGKEHDVMRGTCIVLGTDPHDPLLIRMAYQAVSELAEAAATKDEAD